MIAIASLVGSTTIFFLAITIIILMVAVVSWYKQRPRYGRIPIRTSSEESIDRGKKLYNTTQL